MNPEIRFNPPSRGESVPSENPVQTSSAPRLRNFFKMILKTVAILVLLLVFVLLGIWGKSLVGSRFSQKEEYSAVFLANGQVYFGKLVENNSKEMVLVSVFYLQVGGDEGVSGASDALNQARFNLVKLGNELHGPTDELFINKSQVTFYEKLRPDSKVVESIKNYK